MLGHEVQSWKEYEEIEIYFIVPQQENSGDKQAKAFTQQ